MEKGKGKEETVTSSTQERVSTGCVVNDNSVDNDNGRKKLIREVLQVLLFPHFFLDRKNSLTQTIVVAVANIDSCTNVMHHEIARFSMPFSWSVLGAVGVG